MRDGAKVARQRGQRRFLDGGSEYEFKVHCVSPWLGEDIAAIGDLLCASGPFAIPRLVVSIVVKSVDCQSIGPFAHILKKILERPPPLADFDATPSVPAIVVGCGVFTPRPHLPPSAPCSRHKRNVQDLTTRCKRDSIAHPQRE